MKYVLNSHEAKEIDRYTIEHTGIPSLVLMERASLVLAESIRKYIIEKDMMPVRICAVCGAGNNGGDGIAAARILCAWGYQADIVFAGDIEKATTECRCQLTIAEKSGISIGNELSVSAYNIFIDALFGIGLTRPVTGHYKKLIEQMNMAAGQGKRIWSADIPSGISADTGAVMGIAVRAYATVTFGYMKRGLLFYPGCTYAGICTCEDIGFDRQAEKAVHPGMFTYDFRDFDRLPVRHPASNKGTYGKVLVIAGSQDMAGAAYLSAKAAYRAGSGLVTVCTHRINRQVIHQLLPEAVLKTYSEEDMRQVVMQAMQQADVIVVGPGIGQSDMAVQLVQTVLLHASCPVVADADALNILSGHMEWLDSCIADIIMTPHVKELSRLSGETVETVSSHLEEICARMVQKGVICVAKNARTLVSDGRHPVYMNVSGNSGMSTGGSGDVLTGIIAGFIAQKLPCFDAAVLAVYVHGAAADAMCRKTGTYSLMASDIVEGMSEVLKLK